MKEKIDLSLNRSLEELIASYWEAQYAGLDYKKETHSAFYALENYLSDMGALWISIEKSTKISWRKGENGFLWEQPIVFVKKIEKNLTSLSDAGRI